VVVALGMPVAIGVVVAGVFVGPELVLALTELLSDGAVSAPFEFESSALLVAQEIAVAATTPSASWNAEPVCFDDVTRVRRVCQESRDAQSPLLRLRTY
jgi:hypothetical protein